MADTVKTILLQAIAARLLEIPELAQATQVRRWEDIPADFTNIPMPALYFWESEEKEPWNRLTRCTLDLWLEVFFPLDPDDPASFTAFSESAATMDGNIENVFNSIADLRSLGLIQVSKPSSQNAKYHSERGAFFKNFELTYVHASGDAFRLEV